MMNLNWSEISKRKFTPDIGEEKKGGTERSGGSERLPKQPKAVIIKGVVICSKCQCE